MTRPEPTSRRATRRDDNDPSGTDRPWPDDVAGQLARELAERLTPFDDLARATGAVRPFTTGALERLPLINIIENLDPDTAQAIVAALWPAGVSPTWWQTPLGRAVADQLAATTPDTQVVKIAEAARMLGMSHSRVIQLADNDHLTRTEHGLTLASVYHRIANPGQPGRPGWRGQQR